VSELTDDGLKTGILIPHTSASISAVTMLRSGLSMYVFFITNSVALVRERTTPTERPPLVGEVSANFYG
jgi:hypothetical protein